MADRRQSLRLLLTLAASFLVVLDYSIVNVAMPSIERELHIGTATAQWVITAYAIAFGGLLVIGGRAADLLGRRRMFIVGLVVFSAASLSGGLARDPVLLIASRVIQGAGAALVAPSALSLITTSIPEGHQRTRALGMYGATASIGFVAGQVFGGILVQFTSWRGVFLVNVPVGLAAAALAPALLADSRAPEGARRRIDAPGALLVTAAMVTLVYAVSQVDVSGWTSPAVLGALALCAVSLIAFARAERRHPDPLLPPALAGRPALRTASLLTLLLGIWNGGEMLLLSMYFQQVLGDSALATGLAVAPQGMVGFTAGAFGARLARRIGIHRVLVLTCATAVAGFLILTRLPTAGHYSPVLAAVVFVGFGSAGTAFGSTVTATARAASDEQGVIGGIVNTSRQIGGAIGAAALPAIAVAAGGHQVVTADGARVAMLADAAVAALGVAIALHGIRTARRAPAPAPVQHAGQADGVAGPEVPVEGPQGSHHAQSDSGSLAAAADGG